MLSWTRVALGQGYLWKLTIFEWKSFLSLYFHIFNTVEQDRFHTHAFDGIAVVLRGGYIEEQMLPDGTIVRHRIGVGIRRIPKKYNHRLLRSRRDSMSLLLAGPWAKTWTEENSSFRRTLGWGHVELSREPKGS